MKRTKTNKSQKADAILSADIHLMDSTPVSRTDDYLEAQKKKLLFLQELQKEHDCPVIDAGDIFNHWKPSPWLLERAFRYLPENMITVPGNHDLPEHSMQQYYKSGLFLLDVHSENVQVLQPTDEDDELIDSPPFRIYGIPYGQNIKYTMTMPGNKEERQILILHEMVWSDKTPPWPGAEGIPAMDLLKQFHSTFDLILTGHHHTAFTVEHKGSLLVNPGPMMRISADKAEYRPRCYLYYADTNTVKEVFYSIEPGVHDTRHISQSKERDNRLSAYIERMNMEWEAGLSFQTNLEAFFKRNKTPRKVRELVWHHMEKT